MRWAWNVARMETERNSYKYLILVFWVITKCRLIDTYEGFRGTYCLHLQSGSKDKDMP
jgi:hypothetical protein